jgi:hypothetical protein
VLGAPLPRVLPLVAVTRVLRCRYSSSTESDDVDVEELEMLLEAYFVQIDGITNKLNAVSAPARDRRPRNMPSATVRPSR